MSEAETKADLEAAMAAAAEAVERVSAESSESGPVAAEPEAADTSEATDEDAAEPEQAEAVDGLTGEITALKAKVAELEAAASDWKSKAYRATADQENARRRFQRDREEGRKFAIDSLMKDLLPVVDNLERAVGAAVDNDDPVVQGVRMVVKQFDTLMKNRGAEAFDPLGEAFDPQLHEAMSQIVSTEYAPGDICQVFQRGWKLYDRLVRPAMVIVAMAPPVEVAEDADAPSDADAPTDADEAPEA